MLKSLFPNIQWEQIEVIGFDLDGTLYDELDFIIQVYRPISKLLALNSKRYENEAYNWIIYRWLEKGSSYPCIFDEFLTSHGVSEEIIRQEIIEKCLILYREFRPVIYLDARVRTLLDYFHGQFQLFIVTDGNFRLQMAKFKALGLARWFDLENVIVSGKFGINYQKPATLMAKEINVLRHHSVERVAYLGDREIDREFSAKLGFQFEKVHCLVGVGT
ncbi:MAG: hypothetical protein APF81_00365 [Desulfosporosinus sp. BRH_c37]|nr:MAG: hypothetical protein APF81_00365 [Desulfosporosinus sp. BRH_c37]